MIDYKLPAYFEEDYGHVLIHVAWIVKPSGERILIFGFAEFMPSEYPLSDETPEQNIKVALDESCRIFFTRIRMDVKTCLISYLNLFDQGCILLPLGGNDRKNVDLKVFSPTAEPAWPNLVLSTGRPYVSKYDVNVRSHHAYSGAKNDIVEALKNNKTAIEWLENRVFFSLAEHDELLGSFHLAAHNPVLRSLGVKLLRSKGNEPESVAYYPHLRRSSDSGTLTLFHYEKRLTGPCNPVAVQMKSSSIVQTLSGRAEKVGHIIVCSKRGLLEWSEPVGFLRQIGFSLSLENTKATVEVPDRGGSGVSETYVVSRSRGEPPQMIGSDTTPPAWKKIHEAESQRKQIQQAEKQGQRWFHDSVPEAKIFIRKLVGSARQRVWIVDPYFTSVELFRFALATTKTTAEVLILTSALRLKDQDPIDSDSNAGEVMLSQLPRLKKEYKIKVRVMTGDPPSVHDRFLVIDNAVWFMGNSLHTLGKRAGMMIKLPHPEPIIENIGGVIRGSRTNSLENWVKKRRENQD